MPLDDDKSERRALKIIAYVPVLLCVGIVAWSYYVFIITLCVPLLEREPTQAVVLVVIYHTLLILFMWSYAQVVLVHPGTPEPRARSRSGALSTVPQQRVANIYQPQVAAGAAGASVIIQPSGLITEPSSSSTAGVTSSSGAAGGFSEGEPDGRLSDVRLSLEMVELSVTVKQNGQQRFCSKCNGEKPDRTHHCRMCGQCILKMDHHCPWINSCVGFRNQKHFLLFISWGAVYCLFVAAVTVDRTARMLNDDWRGFASVEVQWAFLILCGGLFGVSLLAFAAYHTYMVLSNQTTIETYQKHIYRIDGDRAPSNRLNLFDVGKKRNWIQVMGEPWYLWFLPISNSPGDGKTWPLSGGHYSALGVDSSVARLSTV